MRRILVPYSDAWGRLWGVLGSAYCNIVEILETGHHDFVSLMAPRNGDILGSITSLLSSKTRPTSLRGLGATASRPSSSPLKLWGVPAPRNTDGKKHRNARDDSSRVVERNHFP